MINKKDKIFLAGHNGFIGKRIFKQLKDFGYLNIITELKANLDLTKQSSVINFLRKKKPKLIINAAGMTGGIYLNSNFPATIMYNNLSITINLMESARVNNVRNLIQFASNANYPEFCKQPMKENYLLTGSLNKNHEPFSIAKIAGIKLAESYNTQYKFNYKTIILPNVFGPGDDYSEKNSSFFAALLKKIYLAKIENKKKIILWGLGDTKRELIYVDDVADACIFLMNKKFKNNLINIGTGIEFSILNYAKFIMKKLNASFLIRFKNLRKIEMRRKLMDLRLLKKTGWKFKYNLEDGFTNTYIDFLNNHKINSKMSS